MKTPHDEAPPSATAFYQPGVSIAAFHESLAWVRFLIGGRGSGKTSGMAMECIRHLWENAGGKALIVRKTEVSNTDTTVETFNNLFAAMGDLYREGVTGLFKTWNGGRTFRVPSKQAVAMMQAWQPKTGSTTELAHYIETELSRYCGHIEMRGLPDKKKSENKLRGFECSIMALVEADLLEHGDFTMAIPCVRMRGPDGEFITDGGLIVETNPPSPRHWIAKLEEETKAGEHPDYEFWHLKTDENRHNLRPGYVEDVKAAYRSNPAMYNRMVNGEYDEAFSGMPVMHAFREEHAGENLVWPDGAVLVRGWDFGTRNAVIWSAYFEINGIEYWHDLYEQILIGSDTDRQAREALQTTENEFPFWNDRSKCSGVLDFCDPAGVNSAFTRQIEVNGKTVKESPVNILRTYGINPGFRTTARGLEETLSIVNRLMEARDKQGRLVYRIDKLFCPNLYRGHKGGYRYPEPGEPGYSGNNEPLKGLLCDHLDHPEDASRYAKINCLRLIKSDREALKAPPTFGKAGRNPNPPKWGR